MVRADVVAQVRAALRGPSLLEVTG
jgi:hypothetical protein